VSADATPLSFATHALAGPGGVRGFALRPRFADGRGASRPSLALAEEPVLGAGVPAPEGARFEREGELVRAVVPLAPGSTCYGTGEVPGPLERSGRRVTLWNTDSFQFGSSGDPLYQSHPYVLVVRADGSAFGLVADTIRRGTLAVEESAVELAFETGAGVAAEPFDLFVLEGAHPAEVTRALAALAGRMPLPPLWALGYHQCRWSYRSAEELRVLALEFRRRGLPCDALWLDIDYMDRQRSFTVDAATFPDLAGLTDELRALGLCSVAILDPGLAVDSSTAAAARAQGLLVLDAAGEPALGTVWPGPCHFPDFTAAAARAWWSEEVRAFVARTGLDGLWTDMNEPSLMDSPTKTLPESCRHAGTDGSGGDHARWHNLYGQLMAEATRAGLAAARPERRPFVLTRASHLGGARFAATWTGDNRATWEHLRWSIPMALNLGLSGQPFSGPDVGGFSDNPDRELFARWFELAALLPFCRGHAEKSSRRKEPWAFDTETEAHVRAALERRMKLLPTLYTLFQEASAHGTPIVRPLFFADPRDARLRTLDDAFLLGDDLLVAPVVHERAHERTVVLPRTSGGWYPFPAGGGPIAEDERVVPAPLGTLPLFARAGSVLFEHEPRPSTATPPQVLVVHAFCDADGQASGRLYEDEGEGHAHARGHFRETRFGVEAGEHEVVIHEQSTGTFESSARTRLFRVHLGARVFVAVRPRAAHHVIARAGAG
jgi:alpha-glucosidase